MSDSQIEDREESSAEKIMFSAERLTFFADAVIAIAITILALELYDPEGESNRDLLHAMSAHRGDYIGFLISFVVIGAYWNSHRRVFRWVDKLTSPLVHLSMFWLLMLVLTPFATRVLSGDGGFQVRFVLYASIQALACLSFLAMVVYVRVRGLYRSETPANMFQNAYFGVGGMALAFLLSIPAAFVTESAYAFWIAVPVLSALARRVLGRLFPATINPV